MYFFLSFFLKPLLNTCRIECRCQPIEKGLFIQGIYTCLFLVIVILFSEIVAILDVDASLGSLASPFA